VAVHSVPPVTVALGKVLDAVIELNGERYMVKRWRGMHMLTDPQALESNRPRLYLVRGKMQAQVRLEPGAYAGKASDTYAGWHRRENEKVGELDTKPAKYRQGRIVVIGYRSDKWGRRGEAHDYSHDFFEDNGRPPLVYTDSRTLDAARTVVIVGGSMRVTPEGIA
jgi:hypothetical protein